MKGIILTLLFLNITLLSKGQIQESYDISIEVEGLQDSVVFLGNYFGEKRYYKDTSEVATNGIVNFSKPGRLEKGVYFIYSPSFYLEFIVREQEFTLKTSMQDPYLNMEIENSFENEVHRVFQLTMKDHQVKVRELNAKLMNASTKEDSSRLYIEARELSEKNRLKRDSLAKAYPDSYVAYLLHLMKNPQPDFNDAGLTSEERKKRYLEYKSSYLNGIDFDDEGSIRAPIFHSKVIEYVDKVTVQNPDSVVAAVDEILQKSINNAEMFRYWTVFFFKKYQDSKIMGLDKAFVHIAQNYYLKGLTPWADEEMIDKLREEMDFHRENQMGMPAPRLYLLDTLLDQFSLRSVVADYTVLYFYRPSCGHCRKSSPVMLDTYHALQADGVEVLGVNVDTDIDEWKEFIDEFQLDWINAADPFTRSNFRRQFNVRSTPTVYVLDRDKTIIAKKLGVEQIEGFLRDRIKFDNRDKM